MNSYKIADSSWDYKAAHWLIHAEGMQAERLSFPTLLAFEEGAPVGVLGTHIQGGMIIAGPLVIRSDRRRVITAIRMAELYEIAMRGMGVTTFLFHTEEGSAVDRFIRRYSDMQPYATEGKQKFFIRRIPHGQQGQGPRAKLSRTGLAAKPS